MSLHDNRVWIVKVIKTNNRKCNCSNTVSDLKNIVDMPGKGRDNKVSPRLSEDQNNFHSTNGEKHGENVKLSKNAIESLVENNEVEAQKEIRGKSTETCEESPAGIDDDKMNESINDTNTTNTSHGKSNELPPTCKSCFIAFAEKKSPACNHQFCLKC